MDVHPTPGTLGWLRPRCSKLKALTASASWAARLAGDVVVGTSAPGHFDLVVAVHWLAELERFAPYEQSRRLRELPGNFVLLCGREPGEWAGVQVRDAVYWLSGRRPPREFPVDWVLARLAGRVVGCELQRSFWNPVAALDGLLPDVSPKLVKPLRARMRRLDHDVEAEQYWVLFRNA